jgi:DNA repair exonuclease SbcCD nuclease subunit
MRTVKFLYITDTHLRGTTPENRKDDLPETLKEKLTEVVELANEFQVAALLHGGDLFDLANPGLATMGTLLQPLKKLECPIYIVPGNHDIYGQNILTLPRTLLGFLGAMGTVNILGEEPVYLDDGNARVQLTGAAYHYDIDDGSGEKYVVKKENCDVAIHLAHGMLLDKNIFPTAAYTLIDAVRDRTEADYTLVGHNHLGFPEVEYNGKWFINPGGLVRLSNHVKEISRIPQVLLIEIEGNKATHRLIPLKSARPGEEILDRSKAEDTAFRAAQRANFLQAVRASAQTVKTDPYSILDEILKDSKLVGEGTLAQAVKDEARRRFAEVEAEFGQGGV